MIKIDLIEIKGIYCLKDTKSPYRKVDGDAKELLKMVYLMVYGKMYSKNGILYLKPIILMVAWKGDF